VAIDLEQAEDIISGHMRWVETLRFQWRQLGGAYEDDFYRGMYNGPNVHTLVNIPSPTLDGKAVPGLNGEIPQATRVQVNIIKGFVNKFEAGMFYRGLRFEVSPDQLLTHDEATDDEKTEPCIAALQDRFFETADMKRLFRQSLQQALLYRGGGCLAIGLGDPDPRLPRQAAEDLVWAEYVPPWESVWDRRASRHRYMGRLRWVSIDEAKRTFSGVDVEDAQALPDVVAEGRKTTDPEHLDRSYIMLFDLYDLEATVKIKTQETLGALCVYQVLEPGAIKPSLKKLARLPMPFARHDGRPVVPLVPVILDPHPDFPYENLPAAKRVYDIVSEYNMASSVLATAYRRDSARIILYLKGQGVDDEVINQILTGADMSLVGIDADTLKGLFEILELPPISHSLLEYMRFLRESLTDTQVLADQLGGKSAKYQTATQTDALVDYSESTLGLLRSEADAVAARLAEVYQAVLYAATLRFSPNGLEPPPIPCRVDGEIIRMPASTLQRRWRYQVLDTATTPGQRQSQTVAFVALIPTLQGTAGLIGRDQEMAAAILDHLVDLADLPGGFSVAGVGGIAEPPPPPPGEGMPPGGPPGMMGPPGPQPGV